MKVQKLHDVLMSTAELYEGSGRVDIASALRRLAAAIHSQHKTEVGKVLKKLKE